MKFIELFEGAEPKLPGAPKGVSIMTPDQFLAKSAKGEEPGPEEDVAEGFNEGANDTVNSLTNLRATVKQILTGRAKYPQGFASQLEVALYDAINALRDSQEQGARNTVNELSELRAIAKQVQTGKGQFPQGYTGRLEWVLYDAIKQIENVPKGVAEGEDHLNRIRKLSGLEEATKLSAPQRDFGDEEFQDYMKRTVGTPDIDKKTGQVKVDKKGKEKYVSGKLKTDKYKLPYIHRSSAIKYYSPEGKRYDPEQVKEVLKQRPKKLLKQNEKMKHSNGELEQFFNIGFAALVGIALDENTNNLIIVNTCPGAGSCKIDCFAMGGGKIQYEAPWQSDGRILTYLLNDPDGFFNQLSSEITKEESDGKKGGYKVSIRWHDAGDFFSPEYMDLAFKLADKFPDVDFYAYTKMAGAALGAKPKNFIINWSEGAHTSQEKQVKANDPNLEKTKNSRIVPDELFQDLLVKNEKGNLIKGASGQWQVQPDKLAELKQRLAKEYSVSTNSILSYDEWEQKTNRGKKEVPVKYNVIVAPGEPDLSANSHGVLGTFLLKH